VEAGIRLGAEADIAVTGVRFNLAIKLNIYLELIEKARILLRIKLSCRQGGSWGVINENFLKFAKAPALSLIGRFLSKINTIKGLTRALQNAWYLIAKYYLATKYALIK
jgi:hypothetical protein